MKTRPIQCLSCLGLALALLLPALLPLSAQQTRSADAVVYTAVMADLHEHLDAQEGIAALYLDPAILTTVEPSEGAPPQMRVTDRRLDDRTVEAILAGTPARLCPVRFGGSKPCDAATDGASIAFDEIEDRGGGHFEVRAWVTIPVPHREGAVTQASRASQIWAYSIDASSPDAPARITDRRLLLRSR